MREFSVNPFLHPNIYLNAFLYVLFLPPKEKSEVDLAQMIPKIESERFL